MSCKLRRTQGLSEGGGAGRQAQQDGAGGPEFCRLMAEIDFHAPKLRRLVGVEARFFGEKLRIKSTNMAE
jgi:hypothetical protein